MIEPVWSNFLWNVGVTWMRIAIFMFCCVGRLGLFKCPSAGMIPVCTMENNRTGQEETLMEVTVGMAVSNLSRAQPGRSCFSRLLALLTLLAIALSAALMLYFFIFAPQHNQVRNVCLRRPLWFTVDYGGWRVCCVCVLMIPLSACRIHPHRMTLQKSA